MPVPYPVPRERIFSSGLSGFEEQSKVQARRRSVCGDSKLAFAWTRSEVCTRITSPNAAVPVIQNSRDVSRFLHETLRLSSTGVEHAIVLCLDARSRPLAVFVPHTGGRNSSAIDPSVIGQAVVLSGATSCIFAHNHPSGEVEPSQDDIEITKKLKQMCQLLDVNLLDSMVLSSEPGRYFSMLDRGLMQSL